MADKIHMEIRPVWETQTILHIITCVFYMNFDRSKAFFYIASFYPNLTLSKQITCKVKFTDCKECKVASTKKSSCRFQHSSESSFFFCFFISFINFIHSAIVVAVLARMDKFSKNMRIKRTSHQHNFAF